MDLDAQLSQSVAGELQLIRDHNDQLSSTNDLRRSLAEMGARLQPGSLVTPGLLADYQIQQGRGLARPLAEAMTREIPAMQPPPAGWAAGFSAGPARGHRAGPGPAGHRDGRHPGRRLAARPARGPAGRECGLGSLGFGARPGQPGGVVRPPGFPGRPGDRAAPDPAGVSGGQQPVRAADARRSSRGGHRGRREPARAGQRRPCRWPRSWTEAARRRLAGRPGEHPRPSLLQVAAHLATEQRKVLLIGPGTGPAHSRLAGAWEQLAGVAIGLLRRPGRAARRTATFRPGNHGATRPRR